ncbi:hexapeptide transferase [Synechococcus sp. SYN20]|uniref:acyltransferase n=1 Tax=Synechococcus sp. SYN20 TaxID=1050714 RepID=UPI0016489D9A|nr:acyltransferase [Synechococcus sp. SYN20]QNJ24561.1 hexapeptide transferase [Synechococcus sp. SYN20]
MSRKRFFSRAVALFASRALARSRAIKYAALSDNRLIGTPVRVQPILALGSGLIRVGRNVKVGCYPSPHFFSSYAHLEARTNSSLISIGENTSINNGFVAIAEKTSIVIGNSCLVGTRCEIYDSDFHALAKSDRETGQPHRCSPVVIEDHVFIGSNVRILKGVTIGCGVVIGNQSVVTRDIPPPHCVASGAPAVVIKQLN